MRDNYSQLQTKLSDAAMDKLVAARASAVEKRRVANESAKTVFGGAPLEGVGQATWMALWEAARSYSSQIAYPFDDFPVIAEGSRCVLCQQPLLPEATTRLTAFEEFVKGQLEDLAKTAESALADLENELPAVASLDDWLVQGAAVNAAEEVLRESYTRLLARRAAASTATEASSIPQVNWQPLNDNVTSKASALDSERASLQALQQDATRQALVQKVKDLKARQWASQNKKSVTDEVARLSSLATLESATALARTNALTMKRNELAGEELATGYQTRFAAELNALGGKRIRVFPESRQEGKGRIRFAIALKGAQQNVQAEKVLSEGEARVVALAAFLADITGSGRPTPFVFDDPITSLDHLFEEAVVRRLIELARTRQVVVLTHRLSLVTLIEDSVDRLKKEAKLKQQPPPLSLNLVSVYRLGEAAGLVHPPGLREMAPQKAANKLRDEAVPKLKKLHEKGDVEEYRSRAQELCSNLRVLVEACVEKVMMNDVVKRFRRSVETKNRLSALAKINSSDCAFIDDLMTRYSVFEHSQSDETPPSLPDLETIYADVKSLAAWITAFEQRPAA